MKEYVKMEKFCLLSQLFKIHEIFTRLADIQQKITRYVKRYPQH